MKRKASISDKTQVEENIPVFPRHLQDRHLCAQNPKSTGQEGTALTRCTARRTAISSESSIADSHPHSRGARLRAPITDLRSRASLCTKEQAVVRRATRASATPWRSHRFHRFGVSSASRRPPDR
ncbi:unnamed protein product [Brassica oleracea]